MQAPLLTMTRTGLYCEAGDFYVDPRRGVDRAVITHAHTDHARRGSRSYLTASAGVGLLRVRMGHKPDIRGIEYGEAVRINGVRVSLHPAGHVLGSSQVRIAHRGEVWVVSGDYKMQADATCAAFDPQRCDVFITESTFALPIFRWQPPHDVFSEINAWWRGNRERGLTSVLYAYALGKAQRLLSGVDPSIGPIAVGPAVAALLPAYEAAGVRLPAVLSASSAAPDSIRGRGLVITPHADADAAWMERLSPCARAGASGWMRLRRFHRGRGSSPAFVLSDHADWPGLISAIEATRASRVGVMHGYARTLARWLRENGRDASEVGDGEAPAAGRDDDEGDA